MKRIIASVLGIFAACQINAQSMGYNDLGVLFSKDQNFGTSRFSAMSGAFGALGSDISSVDINPAGAAVSLNSKVAFTLSNQNKLIKASYYGKTVNSDEGYFAFSQAGAILLFENMNTKSNWGQYALTLNYRKKFNFDGTFTTKSNNTFAFFNEHPDERQPLNVYDRGIEQQFKNDTQGSASVFSIGFSGVYENKLFLGANLNMHSLDFKQTTNLKETNKDKNGKFLYANNIQRSIYNGSGVSLSLGGIYKINHALRVGLAYETPTFYTEVKEENNLTSFDKNDEIFKHWIGHTELYTEQSKGIENISKTEMFDYPDFSLKTPSRFTLSAAYVVNKLGLISLDVTRHNYTKVKFYNNEYLSNQNQWFVDELRNTFTVNLGTEWKVNKFSLRGGYHYQQSPYNNAKSSLDTKGYSLGLGYNLGNTKLDLAYKNRFNKSSYKIYDFNDINPANLDNTISTITATLTFVL